VIVVRTLVVLGPISSSLVTARTLIPLVVLKGTRLPRVEWVGGRVRTRTIVLRALNPCVETEPPQPSGTRSTATPGRR
jgi:hypothetical protein